MKGSAGDCLPLGHVCLWICWWEQSERGTGTLSTKWYHLRLLVSFKMKMSIGVWRETEMGWGLNDRGRKSLAMRDGNLRMLVLEMSVKCVNHMMTLPRSCSLYYKLLKTYWRWNVSPFSLLYGFTKLALFWVISGWFYVWGVIPNSRLLMCDI